MASMGFFTSGANSSIIIHTANYRRKLVPPLARRPRSYVKVGCFTDSDSANLAMGLFSRMSLSYGCGGGRRCRTTQILQATGDEIGVGETDDESEDALQATIEQSKKVIARQRDLLRQIAERKKVVSSIKNSIIDPEGNEQPSAESDNTFYNVDSTATEELGDENGTPFDISLPKQLKVTSSGEVKTKEAQRVASKSYVKPSPEPSSSNGFYKELENSTETIVSFSRTSVDQDLNKNLRNATSKKTVLSEVSLSKKYEQEVGLKEAGLENGDVIFQDPQSEDVKPPPLAGANAMNVILVAVECSPWIKTGGLGDVAGALPKALARRGHRVMVIVSRGDVLEKNPNPYFVVVPRYSNYADAQDLGVRRRYKVDGQDMEVNYFHAFIDGVDFVFIDSPIFRYIDNDIYAGKREDILKRMVLFCKAAVEVPWYVPCGGICYGDGNLAFIANDWHTALLPVYLKAYYRDNGLMQYTRSVLVIHNIAHQGRGPADEFSFLDLPPHYLELLKLYDPVGGDHMNIFAAGIKTADRVVTVSHGYAGEIKTSEGGWGLHGIMNENDWKLRGIVNGIDTKDWSPDSDIHLQSDGYVKYSLDTLQVGKSQCKAALQRELGLPVRADVPLIGFIGRLDHQKGVDVIGGAIPWMMEQDVQLVMLGTGRPDLEDMLRQFEGQYPDKIRGWVGFSVKTAHRITAGADIILMPSRFEPCGLNQLYAMRYGTVPVVHAVGGLRDTVHPFNPFEESGLGWTFPRAESNELVNALGYCFLTYRQHKKSWEALQKRGMMQDLSWDKAAQKYEEVLVAAKYQW